MMQSCGICFEHRRSDRGDAGETEYIAPDLLPDRADPAVEVDLKWDADLAGEAAVFEYALLPPGLTRSVISRIGQQAGIAAEYWKGGVFVYETQTRSRGIIEQERIDDCRGRIRVQTQRGQAAVLLQQLTALVEDEQNRAGLTPTKITATFVPRGMAPQERGRPAASPGREPEPAPKMVFGQEPVPAPEWCVSYAWGDRTPEGREREAIVDRLCAAAEERGISILRDKRAMGLGEHISKFMDRIGQSNRVFIVLSDKYLKSPYCMYELFQVWNESRRKGEEFLHRIRVYTMPGTGIWTPLERSTYAIHWKKQYEELEAVVSKHGYDILGESDWRQYRLMKEFCRNIGDILATVADILQPRSFNDLVKYGFDHPNSSVANTDS